MEPVELLDVHLGVFADSVDEPCPRSVVVVVQFAPRRHPLYPVHRSCTHTVKPGFHYPS